MNSDSINYSAKRCNLLLKKRVLTRISLVFTVLDEFLIKFSKEAFYIIYYLYRLQQSYSRHPEHN